MIVKHQNNREKDNILKTSTGVGGGESGGDIQDHSYPNGIKFFNSKTRR